jgi:capsular exopolysaccharide synthesis family protein
MMEAVPEATTGGIQVTITSTDPKIAPRIVNGIVETHQAVNAETARQNLVRRRVFLEGQLRSTDSLLRIAQSDLSLLRSHEQAYSAEGRFVAEQGNLIQLEIEEAELRGDLQMFESLLRQIEQSRSAGQEMNLSMLMSWPGISSDPNVSSLHSQLVAYTTARDTMLVGPSARAPTHPEVQRLNALIASTQEQLLRAARTHISSIRAQITTVGGLKGRSVAKMSDLPRTEPQEVYLTQNLDALQQSGDQLREKYQEVRLEEAAEAGQVEIVQSATRALPETNDPWMKVLFGLLAGAMLGIGVVLVRERLDHSINRPEEIEQILLVPNLAVIPETSTYLLESSTNGDTPRDAIEPPGVEAYRVLRTNLLFSQGGIKTLVVTSATPGEGKTITAANLAAACARQGRHVLLMECDLRRPALARYFEGAGEIDLSDVLLGGRPWREAIRPSGVTGLDVLLAGRSSRAAEFLAGADMERLLKELSAVYDLVILDTSPLLVAADATVLGAIVDGVLLVVRTTQTDRNAVQHAVSQLTLVGAHVVGTVLNDPEGTVGRHGSYYDYTYTYEPE